MRAALALVPLLLAQGCDHSTYVVVQIDRGAATPDGIVAIDLGLMLAGHGASATLREKDARPIVFPTNTTLLIRNGQGMLTATALARDAAGAVVDQAAGSIEVASGETARLALQLGGAESGDLGAADSRPSGDGASSGDGGDGDGDGAAAPTVPDAPSGVIASSGKASAVVSWNAPASDGGSPITAYSVVSDPGNVTVTVGGSALMANVTGLTNGTRYTFTVTASNANGAGPPSAPSNAVTPLANALPPDAPGTPIATLGGPRAVLITWSAANNNASPITAYTVTASPGGASVTTANGATLSATVAALDAGTSYTFTVVATNGAGTGPASAPSNAITPADAPSAPTGVGAVAIAGNAATVTWTGAASNGTPVTSYTVTASPGGMTTTTADGNARTATVGGLTNGAAYTFTVKANSAVGASPASAPSNTVIAGDVPSAPTGVTAAPAVGYQASVHWAASTAHGSAVTSYSVSSSPGNLSATTPDGSTLSATVTGLTAGTSYTFTVTAHSALGASTPSSATNPAIVAADVPSAPGSPSATGLAGNWAHVSWGAATANGAPVTSYTVTSSPAHANGTRITADGATLSASLGPLANGTSYTFTVVANSALGASAAAGPSNAVIAGDVPPAPTLSYACGADGRARLSYTASAGTPNVYYGSSPGVTPSNGTKTGSTDVAPLTNGTTYYFVMTMSNAYGESAPSGEVSTTPSSAAHDMLITANSSGVQMWDCFSQIPSGSTGNSRGFTSSLISQNLSGALYADGSSLYLSDYNNNTVTVWTGLTTLASSNPTPARTLSGGSTTLSHPQALFVAGGVLYVGNQSGATIVTFPAGWSDPNTAPTATATVSAGGFLQISVAGDELWVANGGGLLGYKGVSGWSGNLTPAPDVQLTVDLGSLTAHNYLGVWADPGTDNIYFSLTGSTYKNIAWVAGASSLSGTVKASSWSKTANAGSTDTLVQAAGGLLLTTDNLSGAIYFWNAGSADGNAPIKTLNPTGGHNGLFYLP